MRRAAAFLALALGCLALAGCETTQEQSAKLEKAAKRRAVVANASGLHVAVASRTIRALAATALHSSEGTAVAVELANSSAAEQEVPLLISLKEPGGGTYTNGAPGLARSLTSVSYVPAHGTAVWVDDQIQLTGAPGAASAKVGEGKPVRGAPPAIAVGAHKLESEPSGGEAVTGTVTNRSAIDQRELVVYALAKRGGKTVAAGRSVLSSLAAGASGRFQIFLLGASARGAQLTLSAPPSTLG